MKSDEGILLLCKYCGIFHGGLCFSVVQPRPGYIGLRMVSNLALAEVFGVLASLLSVVVICDLL